MRKSKRAGAAAAVMSLAAAAVLGGAGIANAQHTVTFNSPSSLGLERDSAGLVYIEYDNRSGRNLDCLIVVSNRSVVNGLDRHVRSASDPVTAFADSANWPAGLRNDANQAIADLEFNLGRAAAPAGYSGYLNVTDGTNYAFNNTFSLNGMSLCVDEANPSAVYIEFERTSGGGGGSLGDLLGSAS